jgi:hypothetical protein
MDKLVRRWVTSLSCGLVFALAMSGASACLLLRSRRGAICSTLFLCMLSIVLLIACVWQWVRFLRGQVRFESNEVVSLDGGEIEVPEFAGPYELWLFSGGWFTQYHGTVSVETSTGRTYVRRLRRLIPILESVRRSPVPLVLRLHGQEGSVQGKSRVTFRLLPSFEGASFGPGATRSKVQLVTATIKTGV